MSALNFIPHLTRLIYNMDYFYIKSLAWQRQPSTIAPGIRMGLVWGLERDLVELSPSVEQRSREHLPLHKKRSPSADT